MKSRSLPVLALCGALLPTQADAIFIQLDYTYDTGNFFASGSQERARLEDAAGFYENLLTDDLDAITPSSPFPIPESWVVDFFHPSVEPTGPNDKVTVSNLSVPADTVIVYVGARDFTGGQLAEAGFGGISTSSTFLGSPFDTAMKTRGESGVGTTDFAPWGGFLSVDDTGTTWDTSLAGSGSDYHLYSTLLHELGHVFGIGIAPSWVAQTSGGNFTGTVSVAEHGGPVALNPAGDHWANGITSNIRGTSTSQEVALDPSIGEGETKLVTDLDVAALDDIGWDIAALPVPEPSQAMLLLVSASALFLRRRR